MRVRLMKLVYLRIYDHYSALNLQLERFCIDDRDRKKNIAVFLSHILPINDSFVAQYLLSNVKTKWIFTKDTNKNRQKGDSFIHFRTFLIFGSFVH
jgi:hypothetical protein